MIYKMSFPYLIISFPLPTLFSQWCVKFLSLINESLCIYLSTYVLRLSGEKDIDTWHDHKKGKWPFSSWNLQLWNSSSKMFLQM